MENISNRDKNSYKHRHIKENQEIYIEKNNIESFQKVEIINSRNYESLEHAIVFCGKGISQTLCNQINHLSEILKDKVFIGVTDRGDLKGTELDESIHIIPTYYEENQIPLGYKFENFFFCELKSIYKYLNKFGELKFKHFTRMRKDIFLLIEDFVNFIYYVPSLKNKYLFITTDQSTNLLRRFCLSDQFFTIPFYLINSIPYRRKPNKKKNFWWDHRHIQPYEIFKNDHQMEQWVWINIINHSHKKLSKYCDFDEYINYVNENILVLPSKQIGYIWNRSSSIYLHNLIRFPSWGKGLLISTKPLRNFTSYSSFISPLVKKKEIIFFFKFIRFLIFIKRLLRFLITFPFYLLRYFFS